MSSQAGWLAQNEPCPLRVSLWFSSSGLRTAGCFHQPFAQTLKQLLVSRTRPHVPTTLLPSRSLGGLCCVSCLAWGSGLRSIYTYSLTLSPSHGLQAKFWKNNTGPAFSLWRHVFLICSSFANADTRCVNQAWFTWPKELLTEHVLAYRNTYNCIRV